MDKTATPEGVVAQDGQAADAPNNDTPMPLTPMQKRMAMMDDIGSSRNRALEDELGITIDDSDPVPAADPDVDPNAPDPEPDRDAVAREAEQNQTAQQLADDDEVLDPALLKRKVKLKVDGQEQLVDLDALVRNAQKFAAADQRLAQASELLRQAQQRGETADTVQPSTGQTPPPSETVKARVKDALEAIFSGDEDAAAEKLASVLGEPRQVQPTINTDEIVNAVTQKVEQDRALKAFFQSYPKIAQDRYLQMAADDLFSYHQSQGKGFAEALEEAGRDIYDRYGFQREQADTKPPATTRSETVNAKKARLDIPAARSVSAAQTDDSPESSEAVRSQTIAEIAASRRPPNPLMNVR